MNAARPTLVVVAHGTRAPEGPAAIGQLLNGVRGLLPDVVVELAYVDVLEPDLDTVLSRTNRPVVVVPMFLAAGYHVRVDVPRAISRASGDVRAARLLGPDEAVINAVAERHATALDGRELDAAVLAAAGSSDPRGRADVEAAAARLSLLIGAPVLPAYVTSAEPSVATAVADLRRAGHGHVSIASYLLAPGLFSRSVVQAAAHLGIDVVAEPIGAHPAVVELVARRYLAT